MLRLEEVKKDSAVFWIDDAHPVWIVTTEAVGDNALTVYFKTPDGRLLERMLFRPDEASLSLAEAGRPWAFDAPETLVRQGFLITSALPTIWKLEPGAFSMCALDYAADPSFGEPHLEANYERASCSLHSQQNLTF